MTYNIKYTHSAFQDLNRIKEKASVLIPFITRHLQQLEEDPHDLSQPSVCPPYPAGYQHYQFSMVLSDVIYTFNVLFKFDEEAKKIVVYRIGHTEGR